MLKTNIIFLLGVCADLAQDTCEIFHCQNEGIPNQTPFYQCASFWAMMRWPCKWKEQGKSYVFPEDKKLTSIDPKLEDKLVQTL